jgi:hypothetical protein
MVATDINLQTLRGRTFEGFVQFQIPTTTIPPTGSGTWYRLKERQTMQIQMQFPRATHYSDDGLLAVDPAGQNHSFQMSIKLTSDMFDNVFSEASDKKTLSYWIYRNKIHQPIQAIFVTSFSTLSGPAGADVLKNDVNIKFVLDPNSFSTGLQANGGSPELSVSGAVISITSALRSTTTSQ